MSDLDLDREIQASLNVDPSPEFVAGVRMRVAQEERPRAWRWFWIATSAAAAATIAAVALVSNDGGPSSQPATVVVEQPATPRDTQVQAVPLTTPVAPTAATPSVVAHGDHPAGRRASRSVQPEVLVLPREAEALDRLLAYVRGESVVVPPRTIDESVIASPSIDALKNIDIPHLDIQPLGPVSH